MTLAFWLVMIILVAFVLWKFVPEIRKEWKIRKLDALKQDLQTEIKLLKIQKEINALKKLKGGS